MHELAIAEGIAEVVTRRASELHATRVGSVRLRVGAASGVVPEALTFSFAMLAAEEPLLAGTELIIDTVPHRAYCRACDQAFAVEDFIAWCPVCGAWSGETLSGTELQVVEMEIVEATTTAQALPASVPRAHQRVDQWARNAPEEGKEGGAR